jgi:hypothetical protein
VETTLALWAPTVVVVASVLLAAGALVGRVKDQEIQGKEHHDWLKSHDSILAKHEVEIEVGKAFRQGYDMGKRER